MPVSPDGAAELAKGVLEVYSQAEETLLAQIAKRLNKGITEPGWADKKLSEVNALKAETNRVIAELDKNSKGAVEAAVRIGHDRGIASAGDDLIESGLSSFGRVNERSVNALVAATQEKMEGTHLRIRRWANDVYTDVVRASGADVVTGVLTRQQATSRALTTWAGRGVTGFVDKAGRNWNLSSYAEMATRTASAQAMVQGHVDKLVENGMELVIVSNAAQECELCRPWEGKVLSLSGDSHDHESFKEAVNWGLFHPNCRHSTSLYQEGITVAPTNTEDPQGDLDRQELRSLERRVREWKRREAAALTPADKAKAKAQVRGYQAKIRSHVSTTSAKRQPHREQLPKTERNPLPALKPVVKPPEPETFLTKHQAVANRMPANRFDLGVHRGQQSAAEVKADRITRVTNQAGGTVAELETRIKVGDTAHDLKKSLLERFYDGDAGYELTSATKWPEHLKEQAKALGLNRRQPKNVWRPLQTENTSWQYTRRNLESSRDRLAMQLDNIENGPPAAAKVLRTNDLTALGDLGPDTRAALDTIQDAGKILDDEIEKRLLGSGPDPWKLYHQHEAEVDDMARRLALEMDDTKYWKLREEMMEGRARLQMERHKIARSKAELEKDRIRVTREVLAEVRPFGGRGTPYRVPYGDKNRLRERMLEAETKYPEEWNSLNEMMHGEVELSQVARGFNSGGTQIALSGNTNVATHELGHSMERCVPGLRGMEWAYHYDRAATRSVLSDTGPRSLSAPTSIYPGTSNAGELGNRDKWPERYTGKVYGNPDSVDRSWEVFTTGIESLMDGSPYFNQIGGEVDVSFRRWVLGVLSVL